MANIPTEEAMQRYRRHPTAATVPIDPDLERRWQAALLSRPANNDSAALTAWNKQNDELLTTYQAAVARAEKKQEEAAKARTARRRRAAAVLLGILLVIGGIVYWSNRPSEDEIRRQQILQEDAACNAHYGRAHHIKVVAKQIDLLQNGEGGWLELSPYQQPAPVGGLTLSPADLESGKTGEAQIDRESSVFDSSIGIGPWAIVERQDGKLILTLFSLSGFGKLPHDPLQAKSASAVTVRGEKASSECL